jgi:cytochrome c oxidase subunit 4
MTRPKLISTSTLFWVWIFLIGLAAINIAVAYLPIGTWTWAITYPIAVVMTLLIMIFFMHLRDATMLVRIFAAAGFFWLMLLFAISLADYLTRVQVYTS